MKMISVSRGVDFVAMLQCNVIVLMLASIVLSQAVTDPKYRLNPQVTPTAYTIIITPHFNTGDNRAFTFDGDVSIKLQTQKDNVAQIKLHAQDLTFTADNITITGGQTVVGLNPTNPLEFSFNYSFVYINLDKVLQVSTEYTLHILYRGSIRDDMIGFYRTSYVENGIKKWAGATQMEPTHARKVFPCFDEPEYKATFNIGIDRPQNYSVSLSNTKVQTSILLQNGYYREIFYPTPKMSTYLVAFLVSEFRAASYAIEGVKEFGIYTRPDAVNQTEYAFDVGKQLVDVLSIYLGIDYYSTDNNLKLNHIALPDFRGGAMENWGLIKYREDFLLYDPEESTPYYKYRVAQIMAHETTHMWFGNLVTCHWWSDTWLNEGFANYFQNLITAEVKPELESLDIAVTNSVYAAYVADENENAPAITNDNTNSPSEISSHFGTITYEKAGSIIRMIHHLIGDEQFRHGLNVYLDTHKFGNTIPTNLYDALQIGVNAYSNSLAMYPGYTVSDIMNSWISQPGHPLLQVDVDYNTGDVALTQKRFYVNSSIETNEIYNIPITYTTQISPDFQNTKPAFIMDEETYTLKLANVTEKFDWIIFNIQETGFYRVNYDRSSWKVIAENLRRNETREVIHHLNRAKLVNDLFALLEAELVNFETLHDVIEFLTEETDYSVWYAALNGINSLRKKLMSTEIHVEFDNYILRLMHNVIERLGYGVKEHDSFVTLRNRLQILENACKLGHTECVNQAVTLFTAFKENGTQIPPSLRPVVYCTGLRYGDAEDFDFIWKRMLSTNVANEALVIQTALGCTKVEEKIKSYLSTVLEENSPIRSQDLTKPFASVLADESNLDVALDFLQENYAVLNQVYPSIETVLAYFPAIMTNEEDLSKFESWLRDCNACGSASKQSVYDAVEKSRASAIWANDHASDILHVLRGSATINKFSFLTMILSVFAIICHGNQLLSI